MKMAQTRASGTYKIDSLATTKEITVHLNDLGIRTGVEIVVVQKDRKGGIILHQGTRIALDARVMEQIDVTERSSSKPSLPLWISYKSVKAGRSIRLVQKVLCAVV